MVELFTYTHLKYGCFDNKYGCGIQDGADTEDAAEVGQKSLLTELIMQAELAAPLCLSQLLQFMVSLFKPSLPEAFFVCASWVTDGVKA